MAAVDDLDNNGIGEIVVGATGDDDGGSSRGAVYVLFVDGTAASLPVELTSFEAVSEGDVVVLSWVTASEENNAGFDVEHRAVGARLPHGTAAQWKSVGFEEGHGTTAVPKSYTYRVTDVHPGLHRFRLRQIDFDGAFEYSQELEVLVEVPGGFVIQPAYPNPFRSRTTLAFAVAREQVVEVVLFDALGRRVQTLFSGRVTPHQMNTVVVDGQDLPSGVYAVHFEGAIFSGTETLIIQK